MPKEKTGPQINCGEVIRKYRRLNGLTKQSLSKALNISANQLGNWETNKSEPRASTILQICRYLDIPLYEMYGIPQDKKEISAEEGEILNVLRSSTPQLKATVRDLLYAVNGIAINKDVQGENGIAEKNATGKKASASTLVDSEGNPIKRGRGRPRIRPKPVIDPANPPVKRGRGRPRIHPKPDDSTSKATGKPHKESAGTKKKT